MNKQVETSDVILIGAGIMSSTLGVMLKELAPNWKITMFEQLDKAGQESSNERNNSGTGHAALCEMNYTIEQPDGTIDMKAAVRINERFQLSRQFWSYLVDQGYIGDPHQFINGLPHISFVKGKKNVDFLRKRYETMRNHPLFKDIVFSDDPEILEKWFPLMMKDRSNDEPVAGAKIDDGTDINYGALTRAMCQHLEEINVPIHYQYDVKDIKRQKDGLWEVTVQHGNDTIETHTAKFVFIGAGGKALPLLQKTQIPESKHIGGFPISGQYLECNNPDVIKQHHAKVYGKNPDGAPLLVVPHLDSRTIDGKRTLIFGPFAGFSPKFLKTGSNKDLFGSVKPHNLLTMMAAGAKNVSLIKYLIQQLSLSKKARMEELREFFPDACDADWDLKVGGQRVQAIKDTDQGKGTIQFSDTDIVSSKDGSLAALLGGSPGASTSVSDMIRLIETCFSEELSGWEDKLKEMIPSYGLKLAENPDLVDETQVWTKKALDL